MSNKVKIWISVLISIIVFFVLYDLLSESEKTVINLLSIIGFLLSILGLVIAFIQILSIKQITMDTMEKVKESIELNNKILMISDLSRKSVIVDEIQGYLRDNKIELCIVRMRDLRIILNSLKNNEHYFSLVPRKQFNTAYENFNVDLYNFHTHHLDPSKMNLALVIQHLEDLSTIFLSMETKLKEQRS